MKNLQMPDIAVLARQAPTRRQVVRALCSAGFTLRFADRASDLDALFAQKRPDLFVLDADCTGQDEVTSSLERAGRLDVPVVMLSLGSDKGVLLSLLRTYGVRHLVAKHGAARAMYPVLDERELLVTCQKVLQRDIFGLEKYIGGWGMMVHAGRVTSMEEKAQLLERLERYLTDLECPPAVVPDILTVADELIVNALLHAPRDEKGTLKYEHLGPVPGLEVAVEDAAEVAWGCDGQRLMLSVADRFGALERARITHYLAKGFATRRHAVEEKVGGAGLGLAMSLKRLHQLVFNVQPQVRTEVLAGWYLRVDTASDFRHMSKSINLFWEHTPEVTAHAMLPRVTFSVERRPLPPVRVEAPAVEPASAQSARALVRIAGRINEHLVLPLPEAKAVRFDLRGVTGFTSNGVIRWLRWMESLAGRDVELSGCPQVVVRSACEVEGFLGGATVRSVLAPYECPDCLQSVHFELRARDFDVEAQRPCDACGGPLRFGGLPQEYEAFRELVGDEGRGE